MRVRNLSSDLHVPRHRREAIACTLAAAWMLLGGRWAAYVGVAPIFLTDILIALGLAHWLVTRGTLGDEPPRRPDVRDPHIILVAFLVWSALRFLLGARLELDAIRDAVPYLYSVVGIVGALALRRATDRSRARTVRVLFGALGLHAAWCLVSLVLYPALPDLMPTLSASQNVALFRVRADYDTAINGVFAAWMTLRLASGRLDRHRILGFVATVAAWVTVFSTGSRAGLLGALLVAGFVGLALLRSPQVAVRQRMGVLLAVPIILGGVVAILPQTTVGERLMGTFGLAQTEAAAGAAGTTQARERTWALLWHYSQDSPSRLIFGVGHGPNFMSNSKAGLLLVGTAEDSATNPRAPHNFWLNTLLREGVIGLGLLALLVVTLLRRAWITMPRWPDNDLLTMVALIPIALLIPATLGVVLESPFGAVPFFWCAGVLLALEQPIQSGRHRPRSLEPASGASN